MRRVPRRPTHVDDDGHLDVAFHAYSGFRVALGADDGTLRLQAPFDEFAYSGALVVDPVDRRATAAFLSDRGVSVLKPSVAPALQIDLCVIPRETCCR